jgi:6-phosphogluconolactonase (cycloisomerase 2 family)
MSSGWLSPVPGSPFTCGGFTMAADPPGRFLYVGDSSTDTVKGFLIDSSSGALKKISTFSWASGLRSMVVEPNGKYLYSANGTSVSQYRIMEATGELSQLKY